MKLQFNFLLVLVFFMSSYTFAEATFNRGTTATSFLTFDEKPKTILLHNYNSTEPNRIGTEILFSNSPLLNLKTNSFSSDRFNIYVRAGLLYENLTVDNSTEDIYSFDFDPKINYKFGFELEFILPHYKKKWALIMEPNFQIYKNDMERTVTLGHTITKDVKIDVNYKHLDLPIGFRYFFFLNSFSRMYVNAAYLVTFNFDSYVQFSGTKEEKLDIKHFHGLELGIGYNHHNIFNIEFKHLIKRELLKKYNLEDAKHSAFSITLGFNLSKQNHNFEWMI